MDILITLYDSARSAAGYPESLPEFIEWLQSILETVPAEYRDSVTVEITSREEYSARIEISYYRPATAEEERERIEKDRTRRQKEMDHLRKRMTDLKQHDPTL
jgi:hypothetical protein